MRQTQPGYGSVPPPPPPAPQQSSAPDPSAEIEAVFNGLANVLGRILGTPGSRKPPKRDVLTYQEVVTYFINDHPGDARIEAGAVLRRPHAKGSLIFQVFLDGADQVCRKPNGDAYGRVLIVRELDPELARILAGEDLVVFR